MKRFYKQVSVRQETGGWQVTLDERGTKTVKGSPQAVPTRSLAEALAGEWADQGETIDPTRFIFRDMADYAIDIVSFDRGALITKLLAYGETDTLCYRADPDEPLYARQQEVWEPLLSGFEAELGATFTRISGIIHRPQEIDVLRRLHERLEEQSAFALTGLESLASLSASLTIALLAIKPNSNTTELWDAASLEEEWQADLWGRDEEAEQRRERRRSSFIKASEFVALARD
ncbi:MAG: ATP12 family protein [Pseudomonadota bacterium]